MVCHLEASVGSKAPVKERRVLNDPKGFLGADFDQIPVSIILDVIVRTSFFVSWAMQHRCVRYSLLLETDSPLSPDSTPPPKNAEA